MSARIPALLVMHADLASALIRAAASVYGPVDGVSVMLSMATIESRVPRAAATRTTWHGPR